ncbi:hypothetical protein ACIQFZ_40395 [Streptomyces sp. NPDC093064]|uniref:hypothetical protein n=1 Tax=Streptomyces sp. NPDC093064 TaxID=3366020 RepID=UPI00381F7080
MDVSDEDTTRIVVVDNRTSDLAGYDSELLADILEELPDLDGTGYDQGALDKLLDSRALPDTIDLPSDGAGTGSMAKLGYLQWGYMQWSTIRVQITAAEVETQASGGPAESRRPANFPLHAGHVQNGAVRRTRAMGAALAHHGPVRRTGR